jgi:hypothetical protein
MNATAIPVGELIGQLLAAADGILADTAAAGPESVKLNETSSCSCGLW